MTKTKILLLVLAGIGVLALVLAAIQLAKPQEHRTQANNEEQIKTEEPENLQQPATPEQQAEQPETIEANIDTTNWKTYRN